MKSMASSEALEERLHHVGVLLEELGAHDEVRRDVLAACRPQVALVDEHRAAALLDQPGRPRLGHPGAVDVAGHERSSVVGVLLREDRDVAAALGVGLEALLLQPGPQRDVLGVAELTASRSSCPRAARRVVISGFTTRNAPPDVRRR